MRVFALVELGDPEAIELFLREEDAKRASGLPVGRARLGQHAVRCPG